MQIFKVSFVSQFRRVIYPRNHLEYGYIERALAIECASYRVWEILGKFSDYKARSLAAVREKGLLPWGETQIGLSREKMEQKHDYDRLSL